MSSASPFPSVERFVERLNRNFRDPLRPWGAPFRPARVPVDVLENDEEVVVLLDCPGFERGDASVRVDGRRLVVTAEREGASEGTFVRRERPRSVRRSLRLPAPVDAESAEATLRDGVLCVTLPKATTARGRTIEITD